MTTQELQKRISEFSKENNLDSAPEYKILDTISELGEVAKEMLKMTDYGKTEAVFNEKMKSELGDLLYSVVTIANSLHIDLEEAIKGVLEKYEKRLRKGGVGSEND